MNERLYIVCQIGEKLIAVDSEQIVEVMPAIPIAPLPKPHRHVLGILIRHARAVLILDKTMDFFGNIQEPVKFYMILSVGHDEIGICAHHIEMEMSIADHAWIYQPENIFEFSCTIDGNIIYRMDLKAWGGEKLGENKR